MHAGKVQNQMRLPDPKAPARTPCTIRRCNLCDEKFLAISKFERFCLNCKKKNELYHYYETLPTLSEPVT